jgi:hypothetical protein
MCLKDNISLRIFLTREDDDAIVSIEGFSRVDPCDEDTNLL